jgi:hypothetical protein
MFFAGTLSRTETFRSLFENPHHNTRRADTDTSEIEKIVRWLWKRDFPANWTNDVRRDFGAIT